MGEMPWSCLQRFCRGRGQAPGERIFLHRHRSVTNTFVVQGEHRLYEPDGGVKEIRPVGSYTCSEPSDDPHSEGGGAQGAVMFYSTRGCANGVLFDVLDDSANQVGTLTLQDVATLFEAQGRKAGGSIGLAVHAPALPIVFTRNKTARSRAVSLSPRKSRALRKTVRPVATSLTSTCSVSTR